MDLEPFTLDQWLAAHDFADVPIRFNLAASTGPTWALGELLGVGAGLADLQRVKLDYAPPEGGRPLREAIAGSLRVDPEWIVVTSGASEALSVLLCLASRPGGNVVIPDPAYPAYSAMAAAWGLGVRRYALRRADAFRQRPAAILSAVDADTVAVVVNSPHNPTGSVLERKDAELLSKMLGEKGLPLIFDEVSHPLYFGARQPSAADLAHVNVVGDMSKALSLPGLRTGWVVEADAERRRRIIDARSYFTISGSPLLERVAEVAMLGRDRVLARAAEVAAANLALLDGVMERNADILAWSRPLGSATAFPWFKDGRNARPWCERLAREGVLVAPGDCFGHPEHFRLGFAKESALFADAVALVEAALRGRTSHW